MTASGGGFYGVEGLSKKEKGLMEMDNNVGITGAARSEGDKVYLLNLH